MTTQPEPPQPAEEREPYPDRLPRTGWSSVHNEPAMFTPPAERCDFPLYVKRWDHGVVTTERLGCHLPAGHDPNATNTARVHRVRYGDGFYVYTSASAGQPPAERADTAWLEFVKQLPSDVPIGVLRPAFVAALAAERERTEQAALVNKHLDNALVEADQRAERYRAALEEIAIDIHLTLHDTRERWRSCDRWPCTRARAALAATPAPAGPACAQHGAVLDTDPDGTTRCSACGKPSDGREG